jgi:poly-gamma-glutamate synthesis protein (capsule biosynthesis protein)
MAQITLFLCGDVMTGRGIDQILPCPGKPLLHEPFLTSARQYVELAQQAHGPFLWPVEFAYVWGEALDEWERVRPDVRIANLETSITQSDDYWPQKDIHYRMSPANLPGLMAARLDCCCLANNHVLDWGYAGLTETLSTLRHAHILTAGAGENQPEAQAPAVLDVPGKGRVLVVAIGSESSGIPWDWAAQRDRAGVNLQDLSEQTAWQVGETLGRLRREGDIAVASIHWGDNWGYEIPQTEVCFARLLVDCAHVDIVHGHSSHHVKGIEVYHQRLILYGCGDFLTDYEGISGHEALRDDLGLMYFASLDAGALTGLRMTPMLIRRMRLERPPLDDILWLRNVLNREGGSFGTRAELLDDHALMLRWT